jgi:flagellar hook-length control protein FliK
MPGIVAPTPGPQGKPGEAAILLPGRQDVAEGGKELPDAAPGLESRSEEQPGGDADGDDADASADDAPPPPFAWFATAPAPPPVAAPEATAEAAPAMTVDDGGKSAPRSEIVLPDMPVADTLKAPVKEAGPQAPAPGAAASEARPSMEAPAAVPVPRRSGADVAAAAMPAPAMPAPAATAAARAGAAPAPPTAPSDPAVRAALADGLATTPADAAATTGTATTGTATAGAAVEPVLAQAPRELRRAAAEAPVVRIAVDRPAQPQKVSIADVTQGRREAAAMPQAAPQPAAAFELPRPGGRANASSDPQVDLSTLAAPATGTQTAMAVSAAGPGQDAALDMRHQQWTARMMDRIETLRDAAPVRETRLSLMPEALGKVDIAIRQDDAGIHVQFHTESQAARQLIADAQPRLAELAEQRGIRLGSTSVESNPAGTGAGTGNPQAGQGQRQDAAPNRHQPSAPPGARREAQASTHDDERVA